MTQETQPPSARQALPLGARASRVRVSAVVAVGIVIAFVVWLIVKDDGSAGPAAPPAAAASVQQLRATQASVGHSVFWAGRRPGFTYELTQVGGNVFVRYLPSGTGVGDARPDFLTVGTYPKPHALASLRPLARRPGNSSMKLGQGGLAVSSDARPQSVYFAYPGSEVQVEVYDPSASRALRLVTSGRVKPIR